MDGSINGDLNVTGDIIGSNCYRVGKYDIAIVFTINHSFFFIFCEWNRIRSESIWT